VLLERTQGAELLSAPSLSWEIGNARTALFKRRRIDLVQAKSALESFAQIPILSLDRRQLDVVRDAGLESEGLVGRP